MAFLVHLLSQRALSIRPVNHKFVAVLYNELLQDVAVERVVGQDFCKQEEHLLLNAVLWVDKRRQFFCEVDCLINSNLDCFVLVFFEQVSQCWNYRLTYVFRFQREA